MADFSRCHSRLDRFRLIGASLGVLFAGLSLSKQTNAELRDPSLPQVLTYGPSSSPAPTERTRPDRSGRSTNSLPQNPSVEWQTRISDGVTLSVLIDRDGTLIALSPSGKVTAIDRRGRQMWTAMLDAPPLASGSLTNESRAVLLSRSGTVTSIDRDGRRYYELFLSPIARPTSTASVPHPSGGVVLNIDADLYWLDEGGEVAAQTRLERSPTTLLLDESGGVLIVADTGRVYRWDFWSPAQALGDLGGRVASVASAAHQLYAVLASGRLVAMDLVTGVTLRNTPPNKSLKDASLALLASGESRLLDKDGALLSYTREGAERARLKLDSRGATAAPIAGGELASAPPLLDDNGTLAFVAAGVPVTVVLDDGSLREAANTACDSPVSLVPAGAERLVLACASGEIWSISQAAIEPRSDATAPQPKVKGSLGPSVSAQLAYIAGTKRAPRPQRTQNR